jgi:hypothetical protein
VGQLHVKELWYDIRVTYAALHREIRDLRKFTRTNFDL